MKKIKTIHKLSILFSLFNFLSLLLLLLSINIIYFYIWYSDIKKDSLYDMNINYDIYTNTKSENNKEAFKNYILSKNTIITPIVWEELICSEWVATNVHNDPKKIEEIKNSFFYRIDWKIYFVFNKFYDDIWTVSILYDTTEYTRLQFIIIKISFFLILFFIIINYFLSILISKISLKDLKIISDQVSDLDISNNNFLDLSLNLPENDDIMILYNTLNKSFLKIKNQNEIQKQFITDVSHEIKTPLMLINSRIDLYKKSLEKWKNINAEDIFLDIKSDVKKINKILETLFFISRLQDNSIELNNKKINIKESVDLIIFNLKLIYKDKNITFISNLSDKEFLEMDLVLYNILFENLFSNSIKFNSKDVIIKLNYYKDSIEITDNWSWIESQKLLDIWEKFKRFNTNIEWFWIWLFLVKRIINIYSWKIDVESEVWIWTKFTIKF